MTDATPAPSVRAVGRHLDVLCSVAPDRRPGSAGNSDATDYVADEFARAGWSPTLQEFDCVDWESEGGELTVGDVTVDVPPSPYGLGVSVTGPVRVLRTSDGLERRDLAGSILVLAGDLAAEPLTPKAYPFYGSEGHKRIVAALEAASPAAVIGVTGRYPALCGALDPFPLIEDGDFSIPTGNVRPEDADPILESDGLPAAVELRARRRPARASNVVATRGPQSNRVTVIAHIDSKPGTPGAVDNAAGVVVLLLLADLLAPSRHPDLPVGVELLAVNGEDHYAAPGEVAWLAEHGDDLNAIALAINIDGAGYRVGRTHYSTYNVDGALAGHVEHVLDGRPGLERGPEWYQSDHAIFAMRGRPALAITTEHIEEMLSTLYHSSADTPDQVDPRRVVEIATALAALVESWNVPSQGAG